MAVSNHPTVCWKTASIDVPACVLPSDSNLKCNKLYIAFNPSDQSDKWVCSTNLYEATGHTQACANYNAKHDGERLNIKTLVYSARARRKHTDTKHLNYMPLYEACSEAERFHCNEFAAWLRQAVINAKQPVEPDDLFSDAKPVGAPSDHLEVKVNHLDAPMSIADFINSQKALGDAVIDTATLDDTFAHEQTQLFFLSGEAYPLYYHVEFTLKHDPAIFKLSYNEAGDEVLEPSALASLIFSTKVSDSGIAIPCVMPGREVDAAAFILKYLDAIEA